ncbi:MAG: ABC transporter substrate-binding protein [Clostridium sp.]|nr:ABC transporter substrate-binding protein [Clostridium sp.]
MKQLTFVMLCITFILFLGLGTFSDNTVANPVDSIEGERDLYLNIITSNKMQYEMVKKIVKDKHNVEYIISSEEEGKSFEFNDEIINNVSNMDLFLYNGLITEPWSSSLISKLNKSSLGTINTIRGIRTISTQVDNHNVDNPYVCTALEEYKVILYNIKSAIQDKDSKNRDIYEKNYNEEIEKLTEIIDGIKKDRKDLSEYQYIALDNNMDYFYRALGINTLKVGKDKTIAQVVIDNKLDPAKVLVLKDTRTELHEEGFRVVNLQSYATNSTIEDMIVNNYKTFYDFIEKKQNK